MATASMTLPSGAKVVIEGTSEEVSTLLAKLQSAPASDVLQMSRKSAAKPAVSRDGPMTLLLDLIGAGFFKAPQELGAVKIALEAQGHFYPTTSLSPLMLRLVRGKHLRRIKAQKRWTYVR
jgi:hypothetical protein